MKSILTTVTIALILINLSLFADSTWSPNIRIPGSYLPNVIGIQQNNNSIPKTFSLEQNYPNPFNPTTTIAYEITDRANVQLTIYVAAGKETKILVKGIQSAGKHETVRNAAEYPSGAYFHKLEIESYSETKKMVLIK